MPHQCGIIPYGIAHVTKGPVQCLTCKSEYHDMLLV